MSEQSADSVRVGDVWRDLDPRGGPTFIVVGFTTDRQHAVVENTGGHARRRKVKVSRIPRKYEWLRNVHNDGSGNPRGRVVSAVVLARCPVCGWESAPHEAEDVPNGQWLAFREGAAEYQRHYGDRHRPKPQIVVREGPG